MVFINGTAQDRAKILAILNRNFTAAERKLMAGLVVEVKDGAGRGVAAFYQQSVGQFGVGSGSGVRFEIDRIVIAKRFLDDSSPDLAGPNKGLTYDDDALTHEVIHFLRNRDLRRRDTPAGRAGGSGSLLVGTDSDLEEAFTEAETAARGRTAASKRSAGYYHFLEKSRNLPAEIDRSGNVAIQGFIHDRALMHRLVDKEGRLIVSPAVFRREMDAEIGRRARASHQEFGTKQARDTAIARMFKGIKGQRAWKKRVLEQFAKTAISRLQLKGKAEAIDTYRQYRARMQGKPVTVGTHIYSPLANLSEAAVPPIVRGTIRTDPGEIRQWHDGKLSSPVKI